MRAAVVTKFGPPEVLEVQEWPNLPPDRGQVVLEVAAADVLFLETMIRRGDAPVGMAPQLPYVQGMDTALLVSAGIALVGVVLALLYLPKTNAPINAEHAGTEQQIAVGSSHTA